MPKHQKDTIIYHNGIESMNNMSIVELLKLSKDELIDVLQGQLAKQPARDVKQRQLVNKRRNTMSRKT